jgi:hypothetical protein
MGVLIGQNVPTPGLAFCLGVASHFMLDLIPHGDSQLYKNYKDGNAVKKSLIYVAVDSILAIIIFVYLLETAPYASRGTMVAGVIGGIIPDFLVALGEGMKIRPLLWFQRLHMRIHDAIASRIGNIPLGTGIVMQLAVLAVMVFIVKR